MATKPTAPLLAKRVWRITAAAPMGEYVDPTERQQAAPELAEPEVTHGGWIESSFDLLRGVEVTEHCVPLPAGVLRTLFGKEDA